jgi:hypothetical protein
MLGFRELLCVATALALGVTARAQSPVSVTFHYEDALATSVGVAGEFSNWKILPMTREANGTWSATIPLSPGQYGYKFVVNGSQWEFDPKNPARKTVDNIENSAITVTATPSSVAPSPPSDGKLPVSFTCTAAKARSVFLAADFNQWNTTITPLQKDSSGVWTTTARLKPGRYQYKFVVDGVWTRDAANPETGGFGPGGPNSVKTVAADAAAPPAAPPAEPATASPSGPHQIGNTPFTPGEVAQFEVPLSNAAWDDAGRLPAPGGDEPVSHNPKPKTVKVAVAVPARFDPSRSWPLLIVNSTVDASCIDHMNLYYRPATECGWVVLAADGPTKPKNDSNAWRWAMVASALEYLHAQWPASKDWPIACGGFSGGAKRSGFFGAFMTKKGYNIIGMWMGGCNEDMASWGLSLYQPNYGKFTKVPIFLSSGTHDDKAKPEQVKGVMENMKRKPFKKVRLESYDGGHDPSAEQIKLGLNWFLEEAKK